MGFIDIRDGPDLDVRLILEDRHDKGPAAAAANHAELDAVVGLPKQDSGCRAEEESTSLEVHDSVPVLKRETQSELNLTHRAGTAYGAEGRVVHRCGRVDQAHKIESAGHLYADLRLDAFADNSRIEIAQSRSVENVAARGALLSALGRGIEGCDVEPLCRRGAPGAIRVQTRIAHQIATIEVHTVQVVVSVGGDRQRISAAQSQDAGHLPAVGGPAQRRGRRGGNCGRSQMPERKKL